MFGGIIPPAPFPRVEFYLFFFYVLLVSKNEEMSWCQILFDNDEFEALRNKVSLCIGAFLPLDVVRGVLFSFLEKPKEQWCCIPQNNCSQSDPNWNLSKLLFEPLTSSLSRTFVLETTNQRNVACPDIDSKEFYFEQLCFQENTLFSIWTGDWDKDPELIYFYALNLNQKRSSWHHVGTTGWPHVLSKFSEHSFARFTLEW
jgi:hypothetical protein